MDGLRLRAVSEQVYIHAKDLVQGDVLRVEGRAYARVQRLRPGLPGGVFVELLLGDGRQVGHHVGSEDWVEVCEQEGP